MIWIILLALIFFVAGGVVMFALIVRALGGDE